MKEKVSLYVLVIGCLVICLGELAVLGTEVLPGSASQAVQQGEPSKSAVLDQKLRHTIETLREYYLIKELDLPTSRAEQLLTTLQDARQIRYSYRTHRAEIEQQLAELLEHAKPDQTQIRQALQALDAANTQYQNQILQADQQLWTLLSPEEQAKYILFQRHFNQQLQDIIARIRQQQIQSSSQTNFLLRRQDQESVIRQSR